MKTISSQLFLNKKLWSKINIPKVSLVLFVFILISFSSTAQTIPGTGGSAVCNDCVPSGWVDGAGTPDISNINNASQVGATGAGIIGAGAPWVSAPLPLPPTGDITFVTLRDLGPDFTEESISTTISGITSGRNYELTVYAMSSLTNTNSSGDYYSGTYIDQFEVQFNSDPRIAITSVSQETWGTHTIVFTGDPDLNGDMTFTIYPGSNSAHRDDGSDPQRELWESVNISVELNDITDLENPDKDGDGVKKSDDVDDDNDGILDVDEYLCSTGATVVNSTSVGTGTYTVVNSGQVSISLKGGDGGGGSLTAGGEGATISNAVFDVVEGDVIRYVVGEGSDAGTTSAGGAGSTGVFINNTLVLVAGGGAGGDNTTASDPNASTDALGLGGNAITGGDDGTGTANFGLGGIDGQGGTADDFSGAGGGVFSAGESGTGASNNGIGGGSADLDPSNGVTLAAGGSAGGTDASAGGRGLTGGGGARTGYPGGAGGYSGGGAGGSFGSAGGGGSYVDTLNPHYISHSITAGADGGGGAATVNGNDGYVEIEETCIYADTDNDGILNYLDLDSDNDGIADIIEAGGVDADNNGLVNGPADGIFEDTDGDGWSNVFDSDNGGTALADTSSDADGLEDRIDLDSDGDGCSDANEYYDFFNADGNADGLDTDGFSGLTYGAGVLSTTSSSVDANGLVINAAYDGSGIAAARDDGINENCGPVFIQDLTGDWDLDTNWVGDVVPGVSDNAIIAADVTSTVTQNQEVKNLVVKEGISGTTTVTVNDTFTLEVKEDLENNGEFTGDGEVVLDGTLIQNLFGAGDYENLRINNSAGVDVKNNDVTDPTEINGVLYVDAGDFTTNDNVLFPCFFEELGAPGSGDFVNSKFSQVGPVSGTITGDVTVEQCFPGRRAFRFVSPSTTTTTSIHENWQEGAVAHNQIPVSNETQVNGIVFGYGTHITGVAPDPATNAPTTPTLNADNNGLDWQPSGDVSMFSFDEATNSWEDVVNTSTPTLTVGDAYRIMIRGSREVDLESNASDVFNTKLRSTGTAPKGNIDLSPSPAIGDNEYAFIGNPFHAIVDLNEVIPSGYTNFAYIFDPTLGGTADENPNSTTTGGRGAFVAVDVTTGNNSFPNGAPTGNSSSEANQFIQPYQSFFVRADATGTRGSIIFEEADKAVDQTQTEVFSISTSKQIGVTLYDEPSYNAGSTPDDAVVIYFSPNGNNAADVNDAVKFPNQDEILSRNEEGSLISFENRAMPEDGEILDFFVMNYRSTNYVMVINVDDFPGKSVYLYDSYTDAETLLGNNTFSTYSFTVDPSIAQSTATDRFELRIGNSTLSNDEFETQGISVYPNPADEVLNISFGENTGRFDQLELYDVKGQLVRSKAIESQLQQSKLDVNALSTGVYILKVSSNSEQLTTKIIVE